jgi:hypothetical protein
LLERGNRANWASTELHRTNTSVTQMEHFICSSVRE